MIILGIDLPPQPYPAACYVPITAVNDLLFVSGQTPKKGNELIYSGKIGKNLTVNEGYEASKICVIRALSAIKSEIGDLDRIKKIVKLTGYVNSIDTCISHSKVIDGASELLEKIFREKGKHARVAVGVNSLPGDAAVEIDLIIQIEKY